MSRMMPSGVRRSCTRSIQTPDRSLRTSMLASVASHSVSKRAIWLLEAAEPPTAAIVVVLYSNDIQIFTDRAPVPLLGNHCFLRDVSRMSSSSARLQAAGRARRGSKERSGHRASGTPSSTELAGAISAPRDTIFRRLLLRYVIAASGHGLDIGRYVAPSGAAWRRQIRTAWSWRQGLLIHVPLR